MSIVIIIWNEIPAHLPDEICDYLLSLIYDGDADALQRGPQLLLTGGASLLAGFLALLVTLVAALLVALFVAFAIALLVTLRRALAALLIALFVALGGAVIGFLLVAFGLATSCIRLVANLLLRGLGMHA